MENRSALRLALALTAALLAPAARAGVYLQCPAPLHDHVEELQREAHQTFSGPVEIPDEVREYRL